MRTWVAIAVAAALGICAARAEAQQPEADINCKDRRGAKREFNKGRLAYRRGDYEEAIVDWQQSYSLCEEPLIHLNIANAYERLGDLKNSLAELTKWRAQAPQREQAELDARIESLQGRIAELDKKDAVTKAEEERRRKEEEERRRKEEEDKKRVAPLKPGVNKLDIVSWSMVGVGGAAVIAGVILDAVAGSSRPAEDEACSDASGRLLCRDAQRDDIESSNTLAIAGDITWIAGAAIAAAGGTLLILRVTGVIGKPATEGVTWLVPFGVVSREGVSGAGAFAGARF